MLLITAAYLTRAGRSVLVLEKNDRPGGFPAYGGAYFTGIQA